MRPHLIQFAAGVAALAASVSAQVADARFRNQPYALDSLARPNLGVAPQVVWSGTVRVPGAVWLRLYFGAETALEGAGVLRLTSLDDQAVQLFETWSLRDYRHASSYFNGEAVAVELLAAPGTRFNRVQVVAVDAGEPQVSTQPLSQCGPADDRLPSTDPRAARQQPTGCTTWLIGPFAGLTAGHCTASASQTMQFNVPLSSSTGQLRHPGPEDQYPYDPTSLRRLDSGVGSDWAVFAVVRNSTTGLYPGEKQGAWYKLGTPPSSGQIRITGYGTDSDNRDRTQTQQTHVGPLSSQTSTRLCYQTDTTGGNSGSPVIREDTGEAVGIHTHGGCTTSGTGCNSGTKIDRTDLQAAITAVLNSRRAGTYEAYGAACAGTAGAPSLAKQAVPPEIGRSFVMALAKLPASSVAIVVFGSSDQKWGSLPLPLALDSVGAAGCKLYASIDFTLGVATGTGQTTLTLPIPNAKPLIGATFFNQLLVIDKAANQAGFTSSNGAKATVGGVY